MLKPHATLVFWVVAITCLPALALTNLVQNPGFEAGTINWRPAGGNASVDADPHSGTKSLKVVSGSVLTGVFQDISVTSGKVYSISAWIKQDLAQSHEGSATFIHYQYFDTRTFGSTSKILHSQYLEYIREAGPYRLSKVHSLAPDSAKLLRITLWNEPALPGVTVTGHFDDVSVWEGEYMTSKANVFINPGFESGSANMIPNFKVTATQFVSSTDYPRSGSRSLKILGTGNWAGVEQTIPLAEGEGLSFRGYVCARNPSGGAPVGGAAYHALSFRNSSGAQVGDYIDFADKIDKPEYTLMGMEVNICPPGVTGLAIEFWITPGSDNGFFDDVQVLKFTKAPQPGVIVSPAKTNYSEKRTRFGAYDPLGRKITAGMGAPSRVANGVYFILANGQAGMKTPVSMGETRNLSYIR